MEVLVFLVPLALLLGLVGLAGFLWSLKNGQYDDLDGAAWRAIADDDPPATTGSAAREAEPAGSKLADDATLQKIQRDQRKGRHSAIERQRQDPIGPAMPPLQQGTADEEF